MLIDTHVHLNDKRFNETYRDIISSFPKDGIEAVINVGYDRKSSEKALRLAVEFERVYCSLGIHPHDSRFYTDADGEWFLQRGTGGCAIKTAHTAPSPCVKVVAIGEIGLDYHYDFSPREKQREAFVKQLEVAEAAGLPVIVHLREAAGDMLSILKENKSRLKHGLVMHCFSETPEYMKECLRLGAYISFAGPVTFHNARYAVECAKQVPADRFLIETDCPYLAPVPHRGQLNLPAYVLYVAEKLSELRGIAFEEIERQSTVNAKMLFPRLKIPL